ncbi:MAG: Asp-tRNA(Asn)/Glu-tRNA(Gln) amidotransferase subunit GatC [Methanomethylovorans sp.]|jgi:aspartyl-tRNA(Asn)/glutamyl-tRNA(Gln) amidotransferase subunit C|nr:Asp-tRNA(Asn)/Glu-tRNA(Gln) amidotransferase subunit GatC [Methanomethylovorans sp.]
MITKEEVEHVGWLARIEIHENEAQDYAEKLSAVLEYFSQLDEVNTENVEPTYHVADIVNVFRDDVIRLSLPQEEVLSNTDKKQEGNFLAPRIM